MVYNRLIIGTANRVPPACNVQREPRNTISTFLKLICAVSINQQQAPRNITTEFSTQHEASISTAPPPRDSRTPRLLG